MNNNQVTYPYHTLPAERLAAWETKCLPSGVTLRSLENKVVGAKRTRERRESLYELVFLPTAGILFTVLILGGIVASLTKWAEIATILTFLGAAILFLISQEVGSRLNKWKKAGTDIYLDAKGEFDNATMRLHDSIQSILGTVGEERKVVIKTTESMQKRLEAAAYVLVSAQETFTETRFLSTAPAETVIASADNYLAAKDDFESLWKANVDCDYGVQDKGAIIRAAEQKLALAQKSNKKQ